MRIHRLELRNYRGVAESNVTFPTTGVTIIEGDNEVGKSSLAEAIDLVLTVRDDSKKSGIKAIQPVDRDAGPEVTIELSTGPYRFVLAKRWLRKAETTLTVLEPQRAQLTGREAHERVTEILAETLDPDLWAALRLEQGGDLEQASFALPSLGRALDAAAGTDQDGHHEDALWERVVAERDRYWTATGKPST
ncbi:MAG: ATP-binding protein, partial [Aquihabitans sp.]